MAGCDWSKVGDCSQWDWHVIIDSRERLEKTKTKGEIRMKRIDLESGLFGKCFSRVFFHPLTHFSYSHIYMGLAD